MSNKKNQEVVNSSIDLTTQDLEIIRSLILNHNTSVKQSSVFLRLLSKIQELLKEQNSELAEPKN